MKSQIYIKPHYAQAQLYATPSCESCEGTGIYTTWEGYDHTCACIGDNYDPDYEAEMANNNYEDR